jgi:hypothetical protein
VNEGAYLLEVTSDDGVRIYVDGQLVGEDWTWHAPTTMSRRLNLKSGKHSIKIEHFELDGYSALKAEITPIRNP